MIGRRSASTYLLCVSADLFGVEDVLYDEHVDEGFLFSRQFEHVCEQYLRSRAGGRWRLELTDEARSYVIARSTSVRLAAAFHFHQGIQNGINAAVSAVSYALAHEAAHACHSRLAATSSLTHQLRAIGRHDRLSEAALTWLWNTIEDGRVEQIESRENQQAADVFLAFRDSLYAQMHDPSRADWDLLQLAFAFRTRGGMQRLRLPWRVEICLAECEQPLVQALASGNATIAPLARLLEAIDGRGLLPDVSYYSRIATAA